MVTGITFVCGEIDCAINVNGQIGVHLNYTVVVAFVPVVAAPRFVGDVFDGESFIRRELDMG